MQLIRVSAVAFLLGVASSAAAQCESLLVERGRLVAREGQSERVVLHEPAGLDHPRWSPSRARIAYARGGETLALVIVRADGAPVRVLSLGDELAANAVMNVGWLDERRVWMEGHVNPSASVFYVWDVDRGTLLTEQWGTWFSPSPDGKRLAYLEHVAHGAPYHPRLYVDGKLVYPASGESGRITHLTWSGDGRRLAVVESTPSGARVVELDVRSGRMVRSATINAPVESLRWTGTAFVTEEDAPRRDRRHDRSCEGRP